MSETVVPLIKAVCNEIGEGPFWDEVTKTLYFVDIGDSCVHMYNEPTDHREKLAIGQKGQSVSFVIPCESGGFLCGVDQSIVQCQWYDGGQLHQETICQVEQNEQSRFNDAKCDPAGRLVAGTMGKEKSACVVYKHNAANLYGLDEHRQIKCLVSDVTLSNGLDWTKDQQTFYFTDTVAKHIYAFDWNNDEFTATNQRVAIDFTKFGNEIGLPDGLAIDKNGNLWIACYFGSRLVCCDPTTGQIIREVKLPVQSPTSCCFGGEYMDELFVTCAKNWGGLDESANPVAGSVFKITGLGVSGFASRKYKF